MACAVASCGGGEGQSGQKEAAPAAAQPSMPVSSDKNAYPVFLDADAGADPSVPAEQGGKGFTGEGWETNTSFDLVVAVPEPGTAHLLAMLGILFCRRRPL